MTDPINQTENENANKPKTNLKIIYEHLKPNWKADFLKIVLGKYSFLFFAFIVLLLWQFFYDVFDGPIDNVYKYLVAYIPLNAITSWFFIFFAAGTIMVYYNKIWTIQYRPNLNFSFIVLFVGVIYFSLRWSDKWAFYTFWRCPVALVDIYFLLLIGEIWSWVKFLSIIHPEKKYNCKSFGLDDPEDNKDEFGRKNFALEIAEYICNSFGQRSLAIGISGSWGTGKSFLLHQIQNSITTKIDKSIIIIKFNPWRSSSHNRIVEDFLQTIKSELSVYDKSLSDKFEKYLKVLIETDKTNWIKTIADALSINGNKSSEQLYNEINNCLQLINKKLVIFIDDLDRLHNEEMIEVFRIVRNTADFYNTCFVVAYDREYVQTSFSSMNLQMGNYLDKIFQTEFVLPTIDRSSLVNVLIHEVTKKFDKRNNEDAVSKFLLDRNNRTLLLSYIQHKRDVIRFTNMYSFDIMSIMEEVDGMDFLMVTLLKMKYPSVYNLFQQRDNRDTLLEVNQQGRKKLYKIKSNGFEVFRERNKKEFSHLNPNSLEIINNLINELFESNKELSVNSIRYVENYYKYFSLSVSNEDLKLLEFWEVIKSPFHEAKSKIDLWFNEKAKGTLEKLFLYYNISEFENIDHIQSYIYGIKKTFDRNNDQEGINQFHVALNEAKFTIDGFRTIFNNYSLDELENKIVDLLFPEGIMDAFNALFIEQLYTGGKEVNNLYSKEKSRELIINRFRMLQNDDALNLLFETWKTIVSVKDFDKWDDDIFKLTNDFANQIIENKEKFMPLFTSRVTVEINLENSGQNKAVLKGNSFRKEYNILKDIANILSNKFLHLPGEEKNHLQKEKKFRISFYRELIQDLKLPAYHLNNFIDLFGPQVESYKDYYIYEASLLEIYPLKKNEFENIDNELFKDLASEFVFRVNLKNQVK